MCHYNFLITGPIIIGFFFAINYVLYYNKNIDNILIQYSIQTII